MFGGLSKFGVIPEGGGKAKGSEELADIVTSVIDSRSLHEIHRK
jgi:hypothetical protein